MICKAIAERPNEFRYKFLADSRSSPRRAHAPPHLGPPARILITPHAGALPSKLAARPSTRSRAIAKTSNRLRHDNHDEEGSTLSGLYDIWEDKFFFTGLEAILSLARPPVREDNATLIPEILENTWIRLALGEAAKVGIGAVRRRPDW